MMRVNYMRHCLVYTGRARVNVLIVWGCFCGQACGHERWNKQQTDDNFDAILALSVAEVTLTPGLGGSAEAGKGGRKIIGKGGRKINGLDDRGRKTDNRKGSSSRDQGSGQGGGKGNPRGIREKDYSRAAGITTPPRRGVW